MKLGIHLTYRFVRNLWYHTIMHLIWSQKSRFYELYSQSFQQYLVNFHYFYILVDNVFKIRLIIYIYIHYWSSSLFWDPIMKTRSLIRFSTSQPIIYLILFSRLSKSIQLLIFFLISPFYFVIIRPRNTLHNVKKESVKLVSCHHCGFACFLCPIWKEE